MWWRLISQSDLSQYVATLRHAAPVSKRRSPVEEALAKIDPDELTPKGALVLLYQLRR
jgi:DNA mismatch repair ATPase MutS